MRLKNHHKNLLELIILYIVDQTLSYLKNRFEQFQIMPIFLGFYVIQISQLHSIIIIWKSIM
jgi:hypothetical protein